jgi:siroheme synthase-like protein
VNYLPILLKLRDRPCLVVGGGDVATKRVEQLLRMNARVTVISPRVTETIERLVGTGQLWLFRRLYATGDVKGYFLAYAATGVAAVDEQIARDAESEPVLLSVVERSSYGDFLNPPIGPEYGDLLDRVEAERLILKSPHSTEKPARYLPNEAAS